MATFMLIPISLLIEGPSALWNEQPSLFVGHRGLFNSTQPTAFFLQECHVWHFKFVRHSPSAATSGHVERLQDCLLRRRHVLHVAEA